MAHELVVKDLQSSLINLSRISCMSNKILAFILPNKLRLPRRQMFLQLLLTIERNVLVKKINVLKCLPKFFFNLDLHTDINQIRTGIGCTRF